MPHRAMLRLLMLLIIGAAVGRRVGFGPAKVGGTSDGDELGVSDVRLSNS